MEACDTSMEKFYAAMHKMKETQYLDLLLKRMTNHVGTSLMRPIHNVSSRFRLLMHCSFLN